MKIVHSNLSQSNYTLTNFPSKKKYKNRDDTPLGFDKNIDRL